MDPQIANNTNRTPPDVSSVTQEDLKDRFIAYLENSRGCCREYALASAKCLLDFALFIDEIRGESASIEGLLKSATLEESKSYLEHLIGSKSIKSSRTAASAMRRFYESGIISAPVIQSKEIRVPIPVAPQRIAFEIISDWISVSGISKGMQATARSTARSLFHDVAKKVELPLVETDEVAGYQRLKDFVSMNNITPTTANYIELNRYSITEIFCLRTQDFANNFLKKQLIQAREKHGNDIPTISKYVSKAAYFIRKFITYVNEQGLTACNSKDVHTPPADPKIFKLDVLSDWVSASIVSETSQRAAMAIGRKLFLFVAKNKKLDIDESNEAAGYKRLKEHMLKNNAAPNAANCRGILELSVIENLCLYADKLIPEFLQSQYKEIMKNLPTKPRTAKRSIERTAYLTRSFIKFLNNNELTELSSALVRTPNSTRK